MSSQSSSLSESASPHDIGAVIERVLAVVVVVVLIALIVTLLFLAIAIADVAYRFAIALLLAPGHDVRDPYPHSPW
eukprot:1606896-Ditylum_brightwellii.AAC.1